jgi:hypothetical protein
MKLPQHSFRELFLLVALVAVGCGWWVEHARLREVLSRLHYEVETGWQYVPQGDEQPWNLPPGKETWD